MEKNLYIDASHPEETRVVLKSNSSIEEYEYENKNKLNFKNNIYLGVVSRVEPSLQAAFVNFGRIRHGFLAFNDIQSDYYQIPTDDKEKLKQAEEKIREELKNSSPEETVSLENVKNVEEKQDVLADEHVKDPETISNTDNNSNNITNNINNPIIQNSIDQLQVSYTKADNEIDEVQLSYQGEDAKNFVSEILAIVEKNGGTIVLGGVSNEKLKPNKIDN